MSGGDDLWVAESRATETVLHADVTVPHRPKRTKLTGGGKHVLVATGLLVVVAVAAVFRPLDGYGGLLASWLAAKEDTLYADGYTDAAFSRVEVGMTDREVADLLGEPIDIYVAMPQSSTLGWRYSRSANDASYRVRVVLFRGGRVVEVISDFYLD